MQQSRSVWSRPWRRLRAGQADPGQTVVLGLGLWVFLAILWTFMDQGSPDLRSLLTNLSYQPVNLAAVVFAWRTAAASTLDPRDRRAWFIVGCAFAAFMFGDALWLFYENILGIDPFPSLADVFYLAYYPVILFGLLAFPAAPRSRAERFQFGLDIAMVLLSGWMVVWYFVLGPTARAEDADLLSRVISVAYPVGDMAVLLGVTTLLLRRLDSELGPALKILALGLSLFIFADLRFGYLALQDAYVTGTWPDRLWIVAQFLCALSGYYQYRSAGRLDDGEEALVPTAALFRALPYVTIVASYILLLLVAFREATYPLDGLVYTAVGITGLVVARQVVTARENARLMAEAATQRTRARFQSLVQNSSDVITIVDADFRIAYQSPSVEKAFGFSPKERVGARFETLLFPGEAPQALAALQTAVNFPETSRLVQWRWRDRHGAPLDTETTICNLLADPNVQGLVLNTRDITERRMLEEQIRHQAFHDTLTDLANRTLFKDRVAQALLDQRRYYEPVAVLFLDLDDFKTINDSLGHAVGDQLLMAVAGRLEAGLRPGDTVARLGGDEFAVLLKGKDTAGATAWAGTMLRDLAAPLTLQGTEVRIRASVGIVTSTAGDEQVEELLRNADVAMYQAKAAGKGGFTVFHPSMHAALVERLEVENELRRAIACEEFVLHYQPTVRLGTGVITGAEALVRWQHPQKGLLPPAVFIPVAEETGFIVELGRWVLRRACQQLRDWQRRYESSETLTISVNLSGKQLEQPQLVSEVAQILHETSLSPECLILEITESVLIKRTESYLERLTALRTLGVRLAIDDFGAGYSSLGYLRWLPVDILKIDKAFLREIDSSPKDASVVSGIINLAAALNMVAVAEGIERSEQLARLKLLRCEQGQGYYFARPCDAAALEPLLGLPVRRIAHGTHG